MKRVAGLLGFVVLFAVGCDDSRGGGGSNGEDGGGDAASQDGGIDDSGLSVADASFDGAVICTGASCTDAGIECPGAKPAEGNSCGGDYVCTYGTVKCCGKSKPVDYCPCDGEHFAACEHLLCPQCEN